MIRVSLKLGWWRTTYDIVVDIVREGTEGFRKIQVKYCNLVALVADVAKAI